MIRSDVAWAPGDPGPKLEKQAEELLGSCQLEGDLEANSLLELTQQEEQA